MAPSTFIQIGIGVGLAVLGWLINNLYRSLTTTLSNKVDKGCHEQCTKSKDDMNKLLLDEIKANRQIALDLLKDFREKSELVIKAVEK